MFSSDSYVAFEQTPDSIVNQHGKINADDIELVLQVTANDKEYFIIIVLYSSFGHAFKYDPSQKKIERLKNTGHVILPLTDGLRVKECDDSKITLYIMNTPQEPGKWIKYYSLDLSKNTFTNTKNCRITDTGKECKEIK